MVKNPPADPGGIRDAGWVSGLVSSPGEENGNPLQYSCLENSTDRGAWWAAVYGAAESWTRLSACVHNIYVERLIILPLYLFFISSCTSTLFYNSSFVLPDENAFVALP